MVCTNKITSQDIYAVLRTETNISKKYKEVSNCSFQELHLQLTDINLTLNVLEWKYGLILKDDTISLQTHIDEFIHIILKQTEYIEKSQYHS